MATNSLFVAKRVSRTRVQHYDASPAVVYPLHWAIDELSWAVGWELEMVQPLSGPPVEGAVFRTRQGGTEQVWVLTNWDPAAGRVDYVHFTAGHHVTEIHIHVSGPEQGPAQVVVTYTWIGLSPAGNDFVEAQTEESFGRWMGDWEEEMAHYLRNGTKLERQSA